MALDEKLDKSPFYNVFHYAHSARDFSLLSLIKQPLIAEELAGCNPAIPIGYFAI